MVDEERRSLPTSLGDPVYNVPDDEDEEELRLAPLDEVVVESRRRFQEQPELPPPPPPPEPLRLQFSISTMLIGVTSLALLLGLARLVGGSTLAWLLGVIALIVMVLRLVESGTDRLNDRFWIWLVAMYLAAVIVALCVG